MVNGVKEEAAAPKCKFTFIIILSTCLIILSLKAMTIYSGTNTNDDLYSLVSIILRKSLCG